MVRRAAPKMARCWRMVAILVGVGVTAGLLGAEGAAPVAPVAGVAAVVGEGAAERPLPAGAVMRLGTTRLRHDGAVTGVVFTPDGKSLVSCAFDDKIRVWDLATGRQTAELSDSWRWFRAIAVSPDGRRLFGGGTGRGDKVCVWDLATGALVMSAPGGRWGLDHLALSPDGQTLATSGEDGGVYLWKMENGLELIQTPFTRPLTSGSEIGGLAFSPDRKLLAVGSVRGKVWMWKVGSNEEPLTMAVQEGYVLSVAFSPDGNLLASAGGQFTGQGEGQHRAVGQVWIWDPRTGQRLIEFEATPSEPVGGIVFSPDGRMLASVATLGNVTLWDPATGRRIRTLDAGHDSRASYGAIAFSPDGKLLAAGGEGVAVSIWEVATGEQVLANPEAHVDVVKGVAVSSDGTLISSYDWRTVRLWDATTGKQLRALSCERGGFNDAALSADGKLVASAGSDGSVRLWDAGSGKEVQRFPGDWQTAPHCMAFSSDGSLLAAVYVSYHDYPTPPSSTVRVWQVGTWRELLNLGPIEERGERMAFSADNKVLVCVTAGRGTVYSWDIPAGTERPVLELPGNLPRTVVGLSRDAAILVDMDPDMGEISLLNPLTGKAIRSTSARGECSYCVVFSADDALLAASLRKVYRPGAALSEEMRKLGIFETATGREVMKFDVKDEGTMLSLAFYPDGKRLVSGMRDSTILVWDLSSAK